MSTTVRVRVQHRGRGDAWLFRDARKVCARLERLALELANTPPQPPRRVQALLRLHEVVRKRSTDVPDVDFAAATAWTATDQPFLLVTLMADAESLVVVFYMPICPQQTIVAFVPHHLDRVGLLIEEACLAPYTRHYVVPCLTSCACMVLKFNCANSS